MEYNGYHAVVTFDDEVGILHGEVIDTRDVITFQGKSVDELQEAFKDSVEEYLEICAERGRVPDKPFSGRVALRMEPETHRAAVAAAKAGGKSLNSWIVEAIERQLTRADGKPRYIAKTLALVDNPTHPLTSEAAQPYGILDFGEWTPNVSERLKALNPTFRVIQLPSGDLRIIESSDADADPLNTDPAIKWPSID